MDTYNMIVQAFGIAAMIFSIASFLQKSQVGVITFQMFSFRYADAKRIRKYGLISSPAWLVYSLYFC